MRARKCATLRHKRVGRERIPDTKHLFVVALTIPCVKKDRRAKGEEKRKKREKGGTSYTPLRVSRFAVTKTTHHNRSFRLYDVEAKFCRLRDNIAKIISLSEKGAISARSAVDKVLFNRSFGSEVLLAIVLRLWKLREKGHCTKTQHAGSSGSS